MGKIMERYDMLLDAIGTEENAAELLALADAKYHLVTTMLPESAKLGLQLQFTRGREAEKLLEQGEALFSDTREALVWLDTEAWRRGIPLFYGENYDDRLSVRQFCMILSDELQEYTKRFMSMTPEEILELLKKKA